MVKELSGQKERKCEEKNFIFQNYTLSRADISKTLQDIKKLNRIKLVANLSSFYFVLSVGHIVSEI